MTPTDEQLDQCLDALEEAAYVEYPPATLQIYGKPERRAKLRMVLLEWWGSIQPEAQR